MERGSFDNATCHFEISLLSVRVTIKYSRLHFEMSPLPLNEFSKPASGTRLD